MRLTKDIKTAILNAALKKAGIPDREAAIKNRYAQWAEAVRLRYVTPEVMTAINHIKEAIETLPKCLQASLIIAKDYEIYRVNVAGQTRSQHYGEYNMEGRSVSRISPAAGTVTLLADDPLTEQLYAIDHDAAALKSEREQLTVSLWAVLDSVTTDKRLVEVWPEAVAFIPADERAASPQLPAMPIADLNKMIGLP